MDSHAKILYVLMMQCPLEEGTEVKYLTPQQILEEVSLTFRNHNITLKDVIGFMDGAVREVPIFDSKKDFYENGETVCKYRLTIFAYHPFTANRR